MLIQETFSEVKFENRNAALTQKPKENKRILPFVTQYKPSVPNLTQLPGYGIDCLSTYDWLFLMKILRACLKLIFLD